MEVHTCKNCCLINQVISNQVQKYDILSEENLGLHNALIRSRDTIMQLGFEIINVRDGLIAERQRNLQMYIQQQTNIQGAETSLKIVVNPEPEELVRNKSSIKRSVRPISCSLNETKDYVSLSKYNDLMNLMDKLKQMFDSDLGLFQSLSDKCISKLQEQLSNMREHNSIMLEMYEVLRNDLFKEKKENVDLTKKFQDTVDLMQRENTKQIGDMKKKITTETMHAADIRISESLNNMKIQLEDRDKLVTRLRSQQANMEGHMEKWKQEHDVKKQEYKGVIDDLRKQLKSIKKKYFALERRRALEAEGFLTDLSFLRKIIKQFKSDFCVEGRKCEAHHEIERLQKETDELDKKMQLCYFQQK